MANIRPAQREKLVPPHVSLKSLRQSKGKTLEAVCGVLTEETGLTLTRGALSAIESGLRGASAEVLRGLEIALDLEEGDIITDYEPKSRKQQVAA